MDSKINNLKKKKKKMPEEKTRRGRGEPKDKIDTD